MTKLLFASLAGLMLGAGPARADDKSPIKLKIVAKKAEYAWDRDVTPKEFKKALEDMADRLKKGEDIGSPPKPPAIDLVLQITNTGKEDVTIHVEGTPNFWTFELKGPGVIDLKPRLAFPAIYRLPKAVTLAPGKSHEIPVKQLSDGRMGISRWIYWTEPGEYTLSATYQTAGPKGSIGETLKSEPVKLKVEEKK
jgi:hypothetical protein